jgi:hypothetical protein
VNDAVDGAGAHDVIALSTSAQVDLESCWASLRAWW